MRNRSFLCGMNAKDMSLTLGMFVLAFTLGLLSVSCAGPARISILTGTCSRQLDTCMDRCKSRQDTLDCELMCRFRGKRCEGFQKTSGPEALSGREEIGGHKALLVDFMGATPQYSKGINLTLNGEVAPSNRMHTLKPGASITAEFTLPKSVRQAELKIRHGPGGTGVKCFVTMAVGSHVLAGRYAPPRTKDGRLRAERWNLTPQIDSWKESGDKRGVRLVIENNAASGSEEPYHIGSIILHYRAIVPRD